MITLQDLKNTISKIEYDLQEKDLTAEDIIIQKNYLNHISEIDIDLQSYLGNYYIIISIS